MISLKSVSKSFDSNQTVAVNNLSLEIPEGEFLILLGESGSGKSTTLKLINRLLELSSGEIFVNGKDILEQDPVVLRRQIGYVIQEIGLFPHMTVYENIAVVPELLNWDKNKIDTVVHKLLEMFNLNPQEYTDRFPDMLSGGQKQRVGVARALAARPELLLMDEPFGALDPITRHSLQLEFKQLQKRLNTTVVMVTHDINEALFLADRIAVMKEGEIVALNTPSQLLKNKSTPYVEELMSMPKKQSEQISNLLGGDKS